jgi:hypothetical protein
MKVDKVRCPELLTLAVPPTQMPCRPAEMVPLLVIPPRNVDAAARMT